MAGARDRLVQPVAMALDRRSAALPLDAVFPRPRSAVAVSPVPAETHWHILLDQRCRTLRARQGVRILRRCRLFSRLFLERTQVQAPRSRGRVLCDLADRKSTRLNSSHVA